MTTASGSARKRTYRLSTPIMVDGAKAGAAGHHGIAIDRDDTLYWTDPSKIVRIDRIGTVETVAGSRTPRWQGGTTADDADSGLFYPAGMTFDSTGSAYLTDSWNHAVRKVAAPVRKVGGGGGSITFFAGRWMPVGTGPGEFSGDGGPAVRAGLNRPRAVTVDSKDNVYIADSENHCIRRVTPQGTISTYVPASAGLSVPRGIVMDTRTDTLYIADTYHHRIVKVTGNAPSQLIVVAGTGQAGWAGDGGPATSAQLNAPRGITLDTDRNLFVADCSNHRVRMIDPDGVISTVAGSGAAVAGPGTSDGSTFVAADSTSVAVPFPTDVAVDSRGDLYIAVFASNRIHRVELSSFAVPASDAYDFGAGGFSVLAVVSPGGQLWTTGSTRRTTIATGNIASRYGPYQGKAGGWELSIVADPQGVTAGTFVRFVVHDAGGKAQESLFRVDDDAMQASFLLEGATPRPAGVAPLVTRVVVVTRDAMGQCRLYLDGVLVDATRTTGVLSADVSNDEPLDVGRNRPAASDDERAGMVRAVGLWKVALTQSQAANAAHVLMNPQLNVSSTVATTVTYTAPTADDTGFGVSLAGTMTLGRVDGSADLVESSTTKGTFAQTLAAMHLGAAENLDDTVTESDLDAFDFDLVDDPPARTATVTATRKGPTAGAEKGTFHVDYGAVRKDDGTHWDLNLALRKAVGEKLAARSSYTWRWEGPDDPAYSRFTTTVGIDQIVRAPSGSCVGLWKLRGPATGDRPIGTDLSAVGNDIPAEQRRPTPEKKLDTVLALHVQSQKPHVLWCWAAVSASVANFYQPMPARLVAKEKVVDDQAHGMDWPLWRASGLDRPLAPGTRWDAEPNKCDYTNLGALALNSLSVYSRWTDGVDMDDARSDLGEGRPVVMRIEWTKDGAGHFLVLSGLFEDPDLNPGTDRTTLTLNDPFWGVSTILSSALASSYQGGCAWRNTIHTWPHWIDD